MGLWNDFEIRNGEDMNVFNTCEWEFKQPNDDWLVVSIIFLPLTDIFQDGYPTTNQMIMGIQLDLLRFLCKKWAWAGPQKLGKS